MSVGGIVALSLLTAILGYFFGAWAFSRRVEAILQRSHLVELTSCEGDKAVTYYRTAGTRGNGRG